MGSGAGHQSRHYDKMTRTLLDIAKALALAALFFFVVQALLQNYQVLGQSMEPNLHSGQHLIVNKAAYMSVDVDRLSKFIPFYEVDDGTELRLFGEPQRGDVVVIRSPQESGKRLVKRIIALPGDSLEIRDGILKINGSTVAEPYILGSARNRELTTIPSDHYYVLGDNRPQSNDSNNFGPVHRNQIIGKAWLAYWPLENFGTVDRFAIEPGVEE